MLKFVMYNFLTKKFKTETGTERRLYSPNCVDEVFCFKSKLPLAHGVEVVASFET
jgi:hypothetical protein